jgi:hypothetical protein
MPRNGGYPDTVAECLTDGVKYRRGVVAAAKVFKRSGPWRGSIDERKAKFSRLNEELAEAYEISTPELRFEGIDGSFSGASSCLRGGDGRPTTITMRGRLSVVTFLHEFAHALGKDERGACRWSINLFRRVFPQQYARLQADVGAAAPSSRGLRLLRGPPWLYRQAELPLRFAVRCFRAVLKSFPFNPSPTSQTRKVNLSFVVRVGLCLAARPASALCESARQSWT